MQVRDRFLINEAPRFMWASAVANLAVILTIADRTTASLGSWFTVALWLAALGLPATIAAGVILAVASAELASAGRINMSSWAIPISLVVAYSLTQGGVAAVVLGLHSGAGFAFLVASAIASVALLKWLIGNISEPANWEPPTVMSDAE